METANQNQTNPMQQIAVVTNQTVSDEPETDHEKRLELMYRKSIWEAYIEQRGKRYSQCRIANYRIPTKEHFAAVEKLKDWILKVNENFRLGQGLFIFGPAGTGKDHLLTGAIHEAIKAGVFRRDSNVQRPIRWIQGPALISETRDVMSSRDTLEKTARAPYINAKLLVLSDICQAGQSLNDFQRQTLYDIVDRRYSNCRPTWLSTNAANREEINSMLGGDITDRLLDGALVVPCIWDSFRKSV